MLILCYVLEWTESCHIEHCSSKEVILENLVISDTFGACPSDDVLWTDMLDIGRHCSCGSVRTTCTGVRLC